MFKYIKYIICMFLSIYATAMYAKNSNPIYVKSGKAHFDQNAGILIYTQNVKMDQGTTHMSANILTTYINEAHEVYKSLAVGTAKKRAHYWDTKDQSLFDAYANEITYLPKQSKIILKGNAEFTQEGSSYQAEKIVYNTETGQIVSPKTRNKKVVMLFDTK